MATEVGRYFYYYGAGGSQPNRVIIFYEDTKKESKKVEAEIRAFNKASRDFTDRVSQLPEDKIFVEMKSTSEKMQDLMKARSNPEYTLDYPVKKFSEIEDWGEKIKYIEELEPKADWRIEITNEVGRPHERVVNLHFFNPT